MVSMYRTEGIWICDINAFLCRAVGKRAMVDEAGRITPPLWSIFVEVQEGEEYEGPC